MRNAAQINVGDRPVLCFCDAKGNFPTLIYVGVIDEAPTQEKCPYLECFAVHP